MTKLTILFALLFFSVQTFSQSTTEMKAHELASGFYLAIKEDSTKQGLKLMDSEEYFILKEQSSLTLKNVDTVYSEFNENCKCYLLTIKFNKQGTKELLDFSTLFQKQKVGFVVKGKLITVPTIFEPIHYGGLIIDSKFTKAAIEKIGSEILKEVKNH